MSESDTLIGWLSGLIPSAISQIGDLIPKSSPPPDPVSHPSATLASSRSAPTPTLTLVAFPSAPSPSASAPSAIAISSSHPPSVTTIAILTSQPSVVASSISTPQSTSVSARPNSSVVVGIILGACAAAICLALVLRTYIRQRRGTGASVTSFDPIMDSGMYWFLVYRHFRG